MSPGQGLGRPADATLVDTPGKRACIQAGCRSAGALTQNAICMACGAVTQELDWSDLDEEPAGLESDPAAGDKDADLAGGADHGAPQHTPGRGFGGAWRRARRSRRKRRRR